ncbi:hypothetical protein GGE07_001151 [Sinorhizobium terangae]|nr:hypothetical protein [Sinorhizobium terangae]
MAAELPEGALIPPSALPGISPTRGEIGKTQAPHSLSSTTVTSLHRVGVGQDGASPGRGGPRKPMRFEWSGQ